MKKVSIVLNCFKRPYTLNSQIEALNKQSIKPYEILIWQNKGDLPNFEPLKKEIQEKYKTAVSNINYGVWSRFAYALNSGGDYICVFDDDTIPGERWIENCLNSYENKRGIFGTVGVIFKDLLYKKYDRHGWPNPNAEIKQVDIVGHSWFFDREMLGAFWREAHVPIHDVSGEDVHLSYAVQKYLGLNTYVPPHPIEDKSLWGSLPDEGVKFGNDGAALYKTKGIFSHFGKNLSFYKEKGFKYLEIE